jgi:hypothetical protein
VPRFSADVIKMNGRLKVDWLPLNPFGDGGIIIINLLLWIFIGFPLVLLALRIVVTILFGPLLAYSGKKRKQRQDQQRRNLHQQLDELRDRTGMDPRLYPGWDKDLGDQQRK